MDRLPIRHTSSSVTIDDPRLDPFCRAWASARLRDGHFAEGYSGLVRIAGNPSRVGLHTQTSMPHDGDLEVARGVEADERTHQDEGVGIPRLAGHHDLAQAFIKFLAEMQLLAPQTASAKESDTELETLIAELLGATLVDAEDELRSAWAALERRGYPPKPLAWMTEAPPWPPASIAKILDQPGENSMNLIQTLAREIAPDPPNRAWLVRSWLTPPRPIDEGLLADLVRGGRRAALSRTEVSRVAPGGMDRVGASAISESPQDRDFMKTWSELRSPMIRIIFDGLVKRYGAIAAVDGASLELRPGELTYLLGPVGAGKTTLARMLAGVEAVDDGEIYFGDRMVQSSAPDERNVGMVFEDLGLWPGMTVSENVGYPLKVRKVPRAERRGRVAETLNTLRIDSLAGKMPDSLTPTQRLRTALARALINQPEFLILDQPLGLLDDRAAQDFWEDLRRIHIEAGVTTLVITDDTVEALALADRLAVIDLGRIIQAGPPRELYNRPADVFVARLLGLTNLLQGQVEGDRIDPRGEIVVRTPLGRLIGQTHGAQPSQGASVTISVRPETLSLGPTIPAGWNRFPATIERIVFRGELQQIHARGPGDWPVILSTLQSQCQSLREGQSLTVSVPPEHVVVLPGKFAVGTNL